MRLSVRDNDRTSEVDVDCVKVCDNVTDDESVGVRVRLSVGDLEWLTEGDKVTDRVSASDAVCEFNSDIDSVLDREGVGGGVTVLVDVELAELDTVRVAGTDAVGENVSEGVGGGLTVVVLVSAPLSVGVGRTLCVRLLVAEAKSVVLFDNTALSVLVSVTLPVLDSVGEKR